ncbi:dihydrofolate reductase-like domain-containing protein [Coniella lustricola]|uniref:2,5-diamino-6-ribosylamino-4(3H)-pyrimidinone 5'-phosphate reductase n=1 Tax=Coniella lustricola TaxID=2025994 RepID=A0A2T2ZWN9_9PEZI|nr:dihydrofolate reductase-like domain-containing protein [Coniella lustricola]
MAQPQQPQQARQEDDLLVFPSDWADKLEEYLPPHSSCSPVRTGSASNQQDHSQDSSNGPQQQQQQQQQQQPFLTLTYAQSLDSQLSLAPGVRTTLSGAESKAMTHFLRSRHDAILVGAGTAVADDPGLNCRIGGGGGGGDVLEGKGDKGARGPALGAAPSPRPVVLDPHARWQVRDSSKVVRLARQGKGRPPWILVAKGCVDGVAAESRRAVESVGGRYLVVEGEGEGDEELRATDAADKGSRGNLCWPAILCTLAAEGVRSVMVEGGGRVIDELLALGQRHANAQASTDDDDDDGHTRAVGTATVRIDSVIVTIAPVWLGTGGVTVSPARPAATTAGPRLKEVRWVQMGEDMVLAGRMAG